MKYNKLFENVTGILSMNGGKLFEDIQKEFATLGYQLKYQVLNAQDYGMPQVRERVILVGFLGKNKYEYPEPICGEDQKKKLPLHD